MDYGELEISLAPWDADTYRVEIRFQRPDDNVDRAPAFGFARLDLNALHQLAGDGEGYGRLLTQSIFADAALSSEFASARAIAESEGKKVRVRISCDSSAPELHNLHWETLRDPHDNRWLAIDENIILSRYLRGSDWRRVQLKAKDELKALIAVADPIDLPLVAIDVQAEVDRVRAPLESVDVRVLAGDPEKREHVTLNALIEALREGYDILYLICHGAILSEGSPPGPYLWLEDETGGSALIHGEELADRIQAMPHQRPRLIVLASCQSAGQGGALRTSDPEGALAALGPRLARAGVPAVIAMLGDISMDTVSQFMPKFFHELLRDGQIDRALAAARGAVAHQADSWMPVLFLRLRGGSIWFTPAFAGGDAAKEKWPAIIDNIFWQTSTPILGSGLTDSLLGSRREIAQRWSDAYQYPMAPHDREDLPQVAQYLAVRQQFNFPHRKLMEHVRAEILARYQQQLPESQRNGSATPDQLDRLIKAAWHVHRETRPSEPHDVLASLPFPVYVTTNPDDLLEEALRIHGKEPRVLICPWKEELEHLASTRLEDAAYRPTAETPLVYHLFGHIHTPNSLVLTEDQYFDYLIGVTNNRDLIPVAVREKLANSALLFLGFRLDEWDFRVLLRSIMTQQSRKMLDKYSHVAVQIEPDEGRNLEPERARTYLESYFEQGANINVFWGAVGDFVKELDVRCRDRLG